VGVGEGGVKTLSDPEEDSSSMELSMIEGEDDIVFVQYCPRKMSITEILIAYDHGELLGHN
jgi:hypothetical protein